MYKTPSTRHSRDKVIYPRRISTFFTRSHTVSKWQTYLFGSLMFTIGIIFSIAVLSGYIKLPKIFATTSWTQTDWSGGVGSSTSNQYVSAYQVDTTTTSGEGSLSAASSWSVNYASWIYRKSVTFDNTNTNLGVTSEALVDFPVLVKLEKDVDIDYSKTKDAGEDVRFTDSNGTVLAYEIEKWDEAGSSYIWVKVPQIDINSNTDFVYMYYGNVNASDGQSVSSVWNSNYKAVFHLKETSGTSVADSTSTSLSGAKIGATNPAPTTSGYVGGAQSFNGTSDYIDIANGYSSTIQGGSTYTVDFWVKPNAAALSGSKVLLDAINCGSLCFGLQFNGSNGFYWWTGGVYRTYTGMGLVADTWYHITLVKTDATNGNFYLNGALKSTYTGTIAANPNSTSTLRVGQYQSGGYFTGGIFDELRISNSNRSLAWTTASYKSEIDSYVTYGSQEFHFPSSGSLTSNIFDASTGHDWGIVSYTTTTPATTSVSVKVRSSNNSDMSGATAWASCTGIASGALASTGGCVTNNHRYIQYQVTLSGDGSATPTFSDITINMTPSDTTPPTSNASFPVLKTSPTGTTITESTYTGVATPYLSFTAGADNGGGSGLKGYCIYLGTDPLLDPGTTKGTLLGTSPVSTAGSTCQFIIPGTTLDLSTSGYISTALTSSLSPYYLLVKAIDNGNNIYQGAATSFAFLYDGTAPTNVAYLSTPSTIYSNVNEMVFSWPTNAPSFATDTHSQVLGYQYQINNSTGTWKGTTHSTACDLDYIPVAEGSHTLTALSDGSNIVIGNNVVYLRTVDNVCNPSTSATYRTGNLEYGGEAPSFAISCSSTTGVVVTPLTNTDNSYSFAWDEATPSNTNTITHYYYMINTQPPGALSTIISNNSTYIDVGTNTSVSTRSFSGLVKGTNTVYVVARDSVDNYSSSTCIKGTFVLDSDYPDPPKNVTVSDASIKASSLWRASLAWSAPDYTGTGALTYTVSRSEDSSTWTEITTTTGTAYVDTVPTSTRYYFKVCSHDTSSESVTTPSCANTVTIIPKGSFTSAPDLASGPTVSSITTKKATIKWTTSRNSDSKVAYGTGSNSYYSEEPSNSTQVTDHTINLTNLSPGTTYFYKTKWTDEDGNTGISEEKSFATTAAPSISNVSESDVDISSALITFTSKSTSKAIVIYGKSTAYGGSVSTSTSTDESTYSVKLSELEDGTVYHYKFQLEDADGDKYEYEDHQFTTLPRPKITNVRFQEVTGTAQPAIIVSWDTNTETSSIITYYPQGRPQLSRDEVSVSLVKGPHKMLLKNLNPQTIYEGQVKGKDKAGNEATSDTQSFTTSTDTRPPQVMNLRIEGSSDIQGSNSSGSVEDAKSQLVVSWDTDEPATSQVEFGEGTGTTYTQKTQEDTNLTTNHVIIISNLTPSKVYHLRTLSKDKAQNTGQSVDTVTITPKSSRSALELVIGNLYDVFGILAR